MTDDPPIDYRKLYRDLVEQRLNEESQHIEQRHAERIRDQILKESLYTDDRFNPVKYVDYLLNTYPNQFLTPSNDQGGDTIYRYDSQSGVWYDDGITFAEETLEQILAEETTTKKEIFVNKSTSFKTNKNTNARNRLWNITWNDFNVNISKSWNILRLNNNERKKRGLPKTNRKYAI